ncbi:hypothetical protein [Psychrobacter sp. JCM 18901]|uniref:hypothetical protein n=1 Tax=Psychrobacter sp. JCM 18901 TaxID=1298609 RepID=UPI0004AFB35D|nr:hypothetical protein [Psychrobacter sp. JCM 18901]
MSISMLSNVFANTLATTVARLPLPAIWTTGSAQQRTLILGVSFAILSNVLFGVLYAYSSFFSAVIRDAGFYLAHARDVGSVGRILNGQWTSGIAH